MIAICVDDEPLVLDALVSAVRKSPDVTHVEAFTNGEEALKWLKKHKAGVAFLDIQLRNGSGIDFAQRFYEVDSELPVVFCTGFDEYARDAFRVHAAGYLTKPILPEDIQREIDFILGKKNKKKLLTVTCFGGFNVSAGDAALPVRRKKTRELLAYLIDRRGSMVTAREICAVLWENQTDENKNMNYLYKLLADLRRALNEVDAGEVLVYQNSSYAVDVDRIDCDYYRYLEGDEVAVRQFMGEYLTCYSWAESTCAMLTSRGGSSFF